MSSFTKLVDDIAYIKLDEKYSRCQLDFVLLAFEGEYRGPITHKEAVIKAFEIFGSRYRVGNRINPSRFSLEEDRMKCTKITSEELFSEKEEVCSDNTENMRNYFRAFSDPPYGTPYTEHDFRRLNLMLFPEFSRKGLDIYSWNDDFSDYFDDGKEWWGTALWSVFDELQSRFVIIGASLTD